MTVHVGPILVGPHLSVWAWRAAIAAVVLAPVIATLAIRRRLPTFVLTRTRTLTWWGLVATVAVVLVSGGIGSPALPVIGLSVWSLVATEGWSPAAVGALGAIAMLAIHALWLRLATASGIAEALLAPAATIAFTGFLPPWFGRQVVRVLGREHGPVSRLDVHLGVRAGASPPPKGGATRREVELLADRLRAEQDLLVLDELLRDIRDATSADEVIYWKSIPDRDRSVPSGWSTEGSPRPMFFRMQDWGSLVRWTAEEGRVQLDGGGAAPQFAAAPVIAGDRLYGVLSLTSGVGLGMSRSDLRTWAPRYAQQVAKLLELFDVRLEYSRQMRRNEQLLEAMKRLQEHKRAESLAPAVCEHAIAVSSGAAAALVRWLPEEQRGIVQYASEGMGLEIGASVQVESIVGAACRDGMPLVFEDARVATAGQPTYGSQYPRRQVPSLAIVPLVHDRRVIGAIVVEGAEPGSVNRDDAQILELLGGSVHGSLEVVWEIEEVTRRARTDALTGLANRLHFDEQMKSALQRTDRSGTPCALVLVDLDHFKQVNDTHGHEAGDTVLRHVAKTLAEGIRAVDTCARYGGEEMAILLPDTDAAGAAELAERLRQAVSEREVRHDSTTIQVTASFGVASFPETVPHGDALFPAADRALYAAKASGRNCIRIAPVRAKRTTPSDH